MNVTKTKSKKGMTKGVMPKKATSPEPVRAMARAKNMKGCSSKKY